MFWADKVAEEIKQRGLPLEWVDDMKTPSGKIHVGALRGVVIHDLAYKALKNTGVNTKYTYVFDNHDPMDSLPIYLPKEKFEQYMGTPLYKIPSPEEGYKNYADYYAQDFIKAFRAIGCDPELLWATDIYESGRMNDDIKLCLDKASEIRKIYEEMYKKPLAKDWYPFQVYCTQCGKVSTTKVYDWDGENVHFTCDVDRLDWAKGCGYKGKTSPFSSKGIIAGKLPWKIEWAVKWKVIGVTVEGAGKDHMSAGGSHDLATQICERIINYPVPYPLPYEFFLVGGKKMSSSKGLGSAASDMVTIFPPEILRFLMVKTKMNQAINFDPSGNTIPDLFDDYQQAALEYVASKEGKKYDEDLARAFEYSQVADKVKIPPLHSRFINLTSWVQMPNAEEKIKEFGMEEWVPYAKLWVEKFAPEDAKYELQKEVPERIKKLSGNQKKLLYKIVREIDTEWNPEDFQKKIYAMGKELELSPYETFSAIYIPLLDKDYGPKAAWLIYYNKSFVKKRLEQIARDYSSSEEQSDESRSNNEAMKQLSNESSRRATSKIPVGLARTISPELFTIDNAVKQQYPSISIGIAVIKGVQIEKTNPGLEKEKEVFLQSLEGLTTEQLGQYPEIVSYRKLYKEMGVDWHSRRPSPEALLRRVALKKGVYSINTCVDAYNLIVMKHRVSVGAFDLDAIVFPTILRFPKQGEEILLLGDTEPTKYTQKELAYFDQKGGYNIDFNYRDAQRTAVKDATKNLYINVDGIYDISTEKVGQALKESCDIIMKYCGGTLETFGIETAS
ncbi:MAG: lysine--tRNA ligase [Candidatus Levybacteria bacterium]|nr:lysine--tRNA ligase [Candidatus Levybacteria bacterium]